METQLKKTVFLHKLSVHYVSAAVPSVTSRGKASLLHANWVAIRISILLISNNILFGLTLFVYLTAVCLFNSYLLQLFSCWMKRKTVNNNSEQTHLTNKQANFSLSIHRWFLLILLTLVCFGDWERSSRPAAVKKPPSGNGPAELPHTYGLRILCTKI